ncbi:MAG: prepilin-type N-terminal cleavage/methylation domain-containing protein [Candidatus Eremiobacterota bacterium]
MKRRGYTLAEVLAATALFLLVVGMAASAAQLVRRSFHHHLARVQSRQDARNLLGDLRLRVRAACYVYSGFQQSMDGHQYSVPSPGQTGPDVVFAVPEEDPGYTVVGVYLEPRTPPDPRNPSACRVVLYSRPGVIPPVSQSPASISLTTLSGGTRKRYDCYVPPGNLQVQVGGLSESLTVDLWTRRAPIDGVVEVERHTFRYALRNGR